jgi:hypothetical protein
MNENEIKIGVIGNIKEGNPYGWFLFIKEDFEESGGYQILISKDPNMSKYAEGYDYWVENKSTLIDMFNTFKWKIQWLA